MVWKATGQNVTIKEFEIIDGQQRLTTAFLLIKAMLDYAVSKNNADDLNNIGRFTDILFDKYEKIEKIRLKPIKDDKEALSNLLNDNQSCEKNNAIFINYQYFINRLRLEDIDVSLFYDSLAKLEIIIMELEQGDDAQVIFESINSTGVGLTEADLIRNFILMGQQPIDQERLFNNY